MLPSDPRDFDVLVAGHVCLDIIPELAAQISFQPGSLVEAGPAKLCPGGAVSNVGTSLSRLGLRTAMIGKVGDDPLGRSLADLLAANAPKATQKIVTDLAEATSYTIVINLSGHDRMFLHCPGANRSFLARDVTDEALASARLLHFGYPPLMESIYADNGHELVELFRRAKALGTLTSLDLSLPDENAPSGQADWGQILANVLPYVDYFLPSLDELAYMLDRGAAPDISTAQSLARQCLSMGAKDVGIKMGEKGLYYLTASHEEQIQPCFEVEIAGTTGSGDATIAGFLTGLLTGLGLQESLKLACATGACCCEKADAVSGVVSLEQVRRRIPRN